MLYRRATFTWAPVAAVIALASVTASFAQDDATVPRIAVVSLARIQANYSELRTQEQDLTRWFESRRSYHEKLATFVFLPKKEFEEALELARRPQPLSETDERRLAELRYISDKNDERFVELRAKTNRTAEETAEFNALQDMYDASAATLGSLQKGTLDELQQRRQSALVGLMDTVQQAIRETAEANGYTLVLDTDAVFYGGDDITNLILERLNGGAGQDGQTGGQTDAQQPEAEQGEQGGEGGGAETGEQGG